MNIPTYDGTMIPFLHSLPGNHEERRPLYATKHVPAYEIDGTRWPTLRLPNWREFPWYPF